MRSGDGGSDTSFPNCLESDRQLPAVVSPDPLTLTIDVADDTGTSADRISVCRLRIHVDNMTNYDEIEVALNGNRITCVNPMKPGQYMARTMDQTWLEYDLLFHLPRQGANEITIQVVKRNEFLEKELEISIEDVELAIRYEYPNGIW